MTTDVRSPGGWLGLLNSRIARWLVVGTLAAGGGAVAIYGDFQGRGAEHYVEIELTAVAAADTMIAAEANPLPESASGIVLPAFDSYVCFEEVPSPASTLDIGVSDADGQGDNDALWDGLVPVANKCFPLFDSGAVINPGRTVVAPRNYSGSASYITARWKTGSGQTASGDPAGFVRVKVEPCTENVDCD
jgi:hypothetical protein